MIRHFLLLSTLSAVLFGPMSQVSNAVGLCAYDTYDEWAPGFDGIQLDTITRIPMASTSCPQPSDGWPLIMSVHGLGGTKHSMDNRTQSNAQKGYIAVSFSWRGHGNSTGTYRVMHRDEWQDLRSLTNWLTHTYVRTRSVINRDRLGIEGYGMGSAVAWMAATQNMGYRSVVPAGFTPYPWDVMVINGCVSGNMQTFFEKPNVRWDQPTQDALWQYFIDMNSVQPLRSFLQSPDRNWTRDLSHIQAYVFAQASWTDTYQFATTAIRGYNNTPSPFNRIYLSANGEEDFLKFLDVSSQNESYRVQWHERWLQDIPNGIENGGPVSYLGYLPGDPILPQNHILNIDSPSWPPPGVISNTLYLRSGGRLTPEVPRASEGYETIVNTLLDPTYTITDAVRNEEPDFVFTHTKIPTSTVTMSSARLAQPVWWLGAPEVTLYTAADGANYNLHALFYDVELDNDGREISRQLIGWAQSCWHAGDSTTRTVSGTPMARRIEAGHVIRVDFQNMDPETSRPSHIRQRTRPYFGNYVARIYHRMGRASDVVLPLQPDDPTTPIFESQ